MPTKNILIVGASRGLGDALATGLAKPGDALWLVSRSGPPSLGLNDGITRQWIQADLSKPEAAQVVSKNLKNQSLDVLIYNAGIWESKAFSKEYNFTQVPTSETQAIITVNLTSAILCVQALLGNLQQSENAKVILIGSTSGLENTGASEVTYNASKFGLRGVAHSLREVLRPSSIGVTILNPGSIGAEVWVPGIPHSDLIGLLGCLIELSNRSCIKEIDMPAMQDPWA